MVESVSMDLGGRTLTFETGHIARQANGACMVRYGDTVVMSAVVAGSCRIKAAVVN